MLNGRFLFKQINNTAGSSLDAISSTFLLSVTVCYYLSWQQKALIARSYALSVCYLLLSEVIVK